MSTNARDESRISFRLPSTLNEEIEAAAEHLGQTVSEFAVSTLVQRARQIFQQRNATVLSDRDRDRFLALLDDVEAKPNKVLAAAACRYRRHVRQ